MRAFGDARDDRMPSSISGLGGRAFRCDGRAILWRLGIWIPLTPWPVLIWIQSLGRAPWSIHSAEALFIVANQALALSVITGAAGLVLDSVFAGNRNQKTLGVWVGVMSTVLQWVFILTFGVAYC